MKKPTCRRSSSRRLAKESLCRSERHFSLAWNQQAELKDVLITSKLLTRRRRPNAEDENVALRMLARIMAEKPEDLIDTLLNIALQLCDAGTAGLSVLETGSDGEQVFRWTNLVGALHDHLGGSTPKDFSPCGVTIERNSPQLFFYPGRRFHYFRDVEPSIVEALVIPVQMGNETPGTIWIVSHDPSVHFDAEDVRIMTGLADFTSSALRLLRSRYHEQQARLAANVEVAARQKTEESLHNVQASLEADVQARTSQLQHLSARLIALQDDERRRLARELHDSAGQYLAAILMSLSAARIGITSPKTESRISEAMEMAHKCNSEIRTISYLLHPPFLDEMGLRSALFQYVEGFAARSGILTELQIPEELVRLPSAVETTLFRVVQQSLANIHRHSGSPSARIEVKLNAHSVSVKICDEGRGIPTKILEQFNAGKGLLGVGLAGMRERIRDMEGRFFISSDENGTTIEVNLPLS